MRSRCISAVTDHGIVVVAVVASLLYFGPSTYKSWQHRHNTVKVNKVHVAEYKKMVSMTENIITDVQSARRTLDGGVMSSKEVLVALEVN